MENNNNFEWLNHLAQLEIDPTLIYLLLALGSVALLICLREFSSWFFKVNDLKADIRELREEIKDLQAVVRESHLEVDHEKASGNLQTEENASILEQILETSEQQKERPSNFPVEH